MGGLLKAGGQTIWVGGFKVWGEAIALAVSRLGSELFGRQKYFSGSFKAGLMLFGSFFQG